MEVDYDDDNWCFIRRRGSDFWCAVCHHGNVHEGNLARHRTTNPDHIKNLDLMVRGMHQQNWQPDMSDLPDAAARSDEELLALLCPSELVDEARRRSAWGQ